MTKRATNPLFRKMNCRFLGLSLVDRPFWQGFDQGMDGSLLNGTGSGFANCPDPLEGFQIINQVPAIRLGNFVLEGRHAAKT